MPLLCLAASETPKELTALGVRLLEEFARLALQASAKVAFIAAHDWEPGDPVRFEAGFLGDFLRFVATSDAWTTKYLGQGKAYLSNTSHESPFWYEVRRDT